MTSAVKYGDKRDYPKIDIYGPQGYLCSTTWARSGKEAKERYAEKHGLDVKTLKAFKGE